MPRSPSAQTVIEYTHRLTSGTLGLMALALPLWAFRRFPRRHPARRYSVATLVLVVVEAGIGAGLVLRGLVALDASQGRAVAVALHLANTLLLSACSALTVAYAHGHRGARLGRGTARVRVAPAAGGAAGSAGAAGRGGDARSSGAAGSASSAGSGGALLVALLGGLLLVAASGAVTALGDTLFPVNGPGGQVPPADHFLVQLRVLHPMVACFVVGAAVLIAVRFAREPRCRLWAWALGGFAGLQLVFGLLNIVLNAPAALQLGHLLGAQLTWLSAVLLAWSWFSLRSEASS